MHKTTCGIDVAKDRLDVGRASGDRAQSRIPRSQRQSQWSYRL
jgi:hypothetical protein